MNNLNRVLPAFAIVVALGAAIYHVRASAMERPPGSMLPPSSRYSGSSAGN